MGDVLARLLAPLDPAEFFGRYWGRSYLHLRRPPQTPQNWLATSDLDDLFQSSALPAASLNVFSDGKPVPIEDWSRERICDRGRYRAVDSELLFRCYRNGATLIVNQAQVFIPRLSAACRSLTHELSFRVSSNVYITPPGSAGFAKHRDDHEVLIVQTLGSKQWAVYSGDEQAVDLCTSTNDLLYLPRGTEHAARTGGSEASVHVTFGMFPPYAFDLVTELAALAQEHPAFQRTAPCSWLGDIADERFEKEFASQLATLLSETGVAGLLARRFHELTKIQNLGWPGRFKEHIALGTVSGPTVVRLRHGTLFTTTESQGLIEIQFGGRSVSIPSFLKGCLQQILNGTPIAVRDLEGLISEDGKIQLVQSLVKSGFLEIVSSG